jgi:hypothetical protein
MTSPSRRRFLSLAAGSTLLSWSDLGFLGRLRPVSAEEARLDPNRVQFHEEIEPLVRLVEDTPRERLLEEMAALIERGLSYREVLAALLLAGIRNVQPRPNVGFKFHAVLVVNSAHLASLSGPDEDRWLPIFWALDYFKSAQDQDVREGNWTMAAVDESRVPTAAKARAAFQDAMERWDEEAADAAASGLARTVGANEAFDLFSGIGARDFRSIGHKAIYVANAWRTLQCIGWHHAEPVVRSLAYALLMHEGRNPSQNDLDADRPGRENREIAASIRADWLDGAIDSAATTEMLATLRQASPREASQKAADLINRGVHPQAVWDGLFAGAGELLARQPGIVGLHTLTTTNALAFAFRQNSQDETRKWLLLQNASFLTMFRDAMPSRGAMNDTRIDALQAMDVAAREPDAAAEEILADVSGHADDAAGKTIAFLRGGGDAKSLIDTARRLVFVKGNDSHDYKFSSAVLEDYYHVSPAWRDRFLAASMFQLPGSGAADNPLIARIRATAIA